ncbi:lantibiotic dehydratase [Streptomyces sp. NBC_01244]|uniref:lantibiotic dehydratase n=1 Tax=Streptomyces sp. NBC_01244 TaxID=2903797 RepID=UPI002E0FB30D|nr:lantibiotic dehydratase [Streptomyces sp. NBC_01244]
MDVDLTGPGGVERGRGWLAAVHAHEQFREALEAASPVLVAQTAAVLAADGPDGRDVRRLVHSTAAYLLRWQGRATPFGYFAGTAPARVGPDPQADWGTEHRVVLRPEADWLGAVGDQLVDRPEVLEGLLVVVNPAAVVRGGRVVAPGRAPAEGLAPLEVSVAATGPVRTVLDAAQVPAVFSDVAKSVAAAFPDADAASVQALLAQLVDSGVLLSSLDAVATDPEPVAVLRAVLGGPAVHHEPLLAPTEKSAGGVSPTWPDTVLTAQVTIPANVLSEAENAASALLRLSPYPFGAPTWRDYHQRFRKTYGHGAVVPVMDLVADSGLGLPSGYLGAAHPSPARNLSARDERFLALAQQAALDRAREVVLTEELLASLAVVGGADLVPPPCVELAFHLHADNAEAVRRGRFEVWAASAARPSSSMAGRFTDLLPEDDRDAWIAALAGPPGPLPAQLLFPARRRRSGNVVRTPAATGNTIALGWPDRGPGNIPLAELAVTCDARHLYLIWSSTGQVVEPRVLHALEPAVMTPPLARFLAELAGARRTAWRLPDWGAASRLPYLPRLRHGRAVLAPARWLLAGTALPGPAAAPTLWEKEFEQWRSRRDVPPCVLLVEGEMRLPLDLDVPLHRDLLRARLTRTGEVALREAPAPADGFMGRAHEFLTVLHAAEPAPVPRRWSTVAATAPEQPGLSRTVCAHLHGHPGRQDEILTEHLPRLLAGWNPAPLWWFTRHHDSSHPERDRPLTFTMHVDEGGFGPAAARLGKWADGLRRQGMAARLDLAAYQSQDGRYGYGPARAAAEGVFAADSAAALAQITYATHTGIPAEALTAASLTDLATAFAPTPAEGWSWLSANLPRESGPVDAVLVRQTLALADPDTSRHEAGARPLLAAWTARAAALTSYRWALDGQREDPLTVLRSLLHLHHVRALGGGPDREALTLRLARTAALAHTHRTDRRRGRS